MPDGRRGSQRPPAGSASESVVERIDAATAGALADDTVPSGFPSLDQMLGGGFRRQDLVVLAGDIGSGKSALALAFALRTARLGVPVLYLSGEMGEERIWERALAIEGRASIDELRQGKLDDARRAAVGAAALAHRDLPLAVAPLPAEFSGLEAAFDRVPRPRLIVVDYLQLVAPPQPSPRQEERTALAVRALKFLALRRNLTVLALAQLPRFRRDRPDPRPALEDLGARGAVKQHADLILGVFREEMYRPDQGITGAAELIVLKHRNGPTGFVDLYFHAKWLRFEDMLDRD